MDGQHDVVVGRLHSEHGFSQHISGDSLDHVLGEVAAVRRQPLPPPGSLPGVDPHEGEHRLHLAPRCHPLLDLGLGVGQRPTGGEDQPEELAAHHEADTTGPDELARGQARSLGGGLDQLPVADDPRLLLAVHPDGQLAQLGVDHQAFPLVELADEPLRPHAEAAAQDGVLPDGALHAVLPNLVHGDAVDVGAHALVLLLTVGLTSDPAQDPRLDLREVSGIE
jgi:hypothetical protein